MRQGAKIFSGGRSPLQIGEASLPWAVAQVDELVLAVTYAGDDWSDLPSTIPGYRDGRPSNPALPYLKIIRPVSPWLDIYLTRSVVPLHTLSRIETVLSELTTRLQRPLYVSHLAFSVHFPSAVPFEALERFLCTQNRTSESISLWRHVPRSSATHACLSFSLSWWDDTSPIATPFPRSMIDLCSHDVAFAAFDPPCRTPGASQIANTLADFGTQAGLAALQPRQRGWAHRYLVPTMYDRQLRAALWRLAMS